MDKYVEKNLSYFEDLERAKNLHKGRRAPVRCDRYHNDKFLSCAPSRSFRLYNMVQMLPQNGKIRCLTKLTTFARIQYS